jgi:hypothetical protein
MSALHCSPSAPNAHVELSQQDDTFISLLACSFTYLTDNIKCKPPPGYEWVVEFNRDTIQASGEYDVLAFTVDIHWKAGIISMYRVDAPFTARMTSHLTTLGFQVNKKGAQWKRGAHASEPL